MRLIGTVARPSSISFASLDFETAMSRSNCGVSSSRVWRSAIDRTRLEWAVATRYGRRWPASPRAMTARAATVSARYMWAWTTSARTSARCAASAPTAIESSGSSMTRTATPARWSLRTALPADSETTDTS